MTPVLLVAPDCPSCQEAQAVWRRACAKLGLVLEMQSPSGGAAVKTVPLLMMDGVPVFAGVPDTRQAEELLARCKSRHIPGKT